LLKKEYLKTVRNTLDSAVYGHKEAKKQLERIFAQWINGETKGAVLGLCGPPGTGKTSLAKNGLSKCLIDNDNKPRPFAFLPIGGSVNGSTLVGHNYTYVGSTWGRIVDILMIKDNYVFNEIPINTKIEFFINGEQHDLTILDVKLKEATFKLASDNPIIFTLSKNSTGYYDINHDTIPDVSITLNNIKNDSVDLILTIYDKKEISKLHEYIQHNKTILLVLSTSLLTLLLFRKKKMRYNK
jgi:DNA polymerase III delta prime subunit